MGVDLPIQRYEGSAVFHTLTYFPINALYTEALEELGKTCGSR